MVSLLACRRLLLLARADSPAAVVLAGPLRDVESSETDGEGGEACCSPSEKVTDRLFFVEDEPFFLS